MYLFRQGCVVMVLEIGKGGKGQVFMEKFYRSSKWWEVTDWSESVSELGIGEKNNNKKLYTVLSYWVFYLSYML